MAFYDHTYASYPFELSSYCKNLDSGGRQTYIDKLKLHPEDGQVFFVPDPYSIKKDQWNCNMESFPSITMSSIEDYLKETPGKNYRSRSAYDYVISGKVQDVKVFFPSGHPSFRILSADVQPSQRCNSDAHQPWIICTDNGAVKTAHCTCLAGFGEACSHVFAVLYQVQFAVSIKLTQTPTEKQCEWNQRSQKKKVPFAALKDITFDKVNWATGEKKRRKLEVKPRAIKRPLSAEKIAALKAVSPNAVFFTLLPPDSDETESGEDEDDDEDLPPTIAEVLAKTTVKDVNSLLPYFSNRTLKNLETKTTCQKNNLWFNHRVGRLTASIFHEVLRKKKVTDKFLIKVTTIPKENNSTYCRWGKNNEKNGFEAYFESEKLKHNNFTLRKAGLFISSTDPYLGASPDGYISCTCCGEGVLEIKCPYKYLNEDPKKIADVDESFYLDKDGSLKEDHPHYAQVQGQMSITNTEYCDFVVWTKKDFITTRVRRDNYFWDETKEILKSFYFKHILPYLQNKNNMEKPSTSK